MAVRPDPPAARAENAVAGGARHGGGPGLGAGLQTAHRLALQHRAPGLPGVQLHCCREEKAHFQGMSWCHMISDGAVMISFSLDCANVCFCLAPLFNWQPVHFPLHVEQQARICF